MGRKPPVKRAPVDGCPPGWSLLYLAGFSPAPGAVPLGRKLEKARLKLDLHTHCYEATGFAEPTEEVVAQIVERIRAQGLDGIAITDHDFQLRRRDPDYAYKVREIVQRLAPDLLIIPGREFFQDNTEVVELSLPGDRLFRFLAHPGYPSYLRAEFSPDNLQGIEVENALHHWIIPQDRVRELARQYGLLLLANSDAHTLRDIGAHHNEIDLETLCARAKPPTSGQR